MVAPSPRVGLRRALAPFVLITTLVVSGCSLSGEDAKPTPAGTGGAGPAPEGLERFYDQELAWEDCGEHQCADMTVPVDWEEPQGETIDIAVLKAPARGEAIGSLVVNPGGPGGSGVEYASYADMGIVSPAVRRSYDVVGFDPRGVGQSAPITCVDDAQLDELLGMDPTPDSDAEREEGEQVAADFAQACGQKAGPLLAHVSTRDVARDMDVLRAVLDQPKLTYLGKSYGTYLGAIYADLFPERVGRMVLDGVLPPDISDDDVIVGQAEGFDTATRAWAAACAEDGCSLGGSEQEVIDTMLGVLEDLDRSPIPGAGGLELTEGWASLGVAQAMYDEGLWDQLTTALEAAQSGDGGPLSALAFSYADREADGSYAGNIMQVIYAVNCVDRPGATGDAARAKLTERAEQAAPIWGRFMTSGSSACEEWPIKPVADPAPISAKGADPILVVGTTRDPATPYAWAQRLHEQLDDSTLITHEGDGHTAYGRQNSCVDDAVDRFWLTGERPAEDLTCGEGSS